MLARLVLGDSAAAARVYLSGRGRVHAEIGGLLSWRKFLGYYYWEKEMELILQCICRSGSLLEMDKIFSCFRFFLDIDRRS